MTTRVQAASCPSGPAPTGSTSAVDAPRANVPPDPAITHVYARGPHSHCKIVHPIPQEPNAHTRRDIEYSVTSTLNVESTILERRVFPFVVKPVPVVGPVDPCSA